MKATNSNENKTCRGMKLPLIKMKKPTDATIRNVKASNTRDAKLLAMIRDLERRVRALEKAVK